MSALVTEVLGLLEWVSSSRKKFLSLKKNITHLTNVRIEIASVYMLDWMNFNFK